MSRTNRQEETRKLVQLYNMGMVSKKYLMGHLGLPEDAAPSRFWRRARRDDDTALANWRRRIFGR